MAPDGLKIEIDQEPFGKEYKVVSYNGDEITGCMSTGWGSSAPFSSDYSAREHLYKYIIDSPKIIGYNI